MATFPTTQYKEGRYDCSDVTPHPTAKCQKPIANQKKPAAKHKEPIPFDTPEFSNLRRKEDIFSEIPDSEVNDEDLIRYKKFGVG